MNAARWGTTPYAIHIESPSDFARGSDELMRSVGLSVVHLNLQDVRDRDQLCDRLAETFMFPYASSGLDGAVDLISDLHWMASEHGYLLVVESADAPAHVVAELASVLPAIVDRWRAQGVPFVVVMRGWEQAGLQDALERANAALDDAGKLSWAQPGTGRVPVFDHQTSRYDDSSEPG